MLDVVVGGIAGLVERMELLLGWRFVRMIVWMMFAGPDFERLLL